jgi:hypothetical protein
LEHVASQAIPDNPVPGNPVPVTCDHPEPEFLYTFPFEFEVIFIVPSELIADPQLVPPIFVLDQFSPESVDVYTQDSSLTPATQLVPSLLAAKELKFGPYPAHLWFMPEPDGELQVR